MNFSQRLKALMEEFGYTDYKLAKALGCHQSSVANWTNGRNKPQSRTMKDIADIFEVSVEYLKGETTERKQKETATKEGDGISDKDIRLLAWFRSLPPEKQKEVLYDAGAPAGLV